MQKNIIIAMALAAIVIFSSFQYWSQQRFQRIYQQQSQNLIQNYQQRAAYPTNENEDFFTANQRQSINFTAENNFNKAITSLENEELTEDFRNDFLLGFNFLQKNELVQADFHLQIVANQNCILQPDAAFLLALSALRAENIALAKQFLLKVSNSDNNFKQQAKDILKQL